MDTATIYLFYLLQFDMPHAAKMLPKFTSTYVYVYSAKKEISIF